LSKGKRLVVVVALVLAAGGVMAVASAAPKPPTRVEAQVGSSLPSVPTSFGRLIDQSAPTIGSTFPTSGGSYNNLRWSSGCSPAGICGTAADPGGVVSVGVALRQLSSGRYWNGSSFSSSSVLFQSASLTTTGGASTSWTYGFSPAPIDGRYAVSARATDNFGNTTAIYRYSATPFTIDNVAPPAPALKKNPSNPSNDKSPEFEFIDADPSVTFTCKLDAGALTPCTGHADRDGDDDNRDEHRQDDNNPAFGEIEYHDLTPGAQHCFFVHATDVTGNVGPTFTYCWTINAAPMHFTISGNVTPPLYPGARQPLTLSIHNPNAAAITIPVNGITVTVTTSKPGCANTNFAGSTGLAAPIVVGPGATVPAPGFSVSMLESGVPQDNCQGAPLTLHYSGSATR
jgi:hypothetical protein